MICDHRLFAHQVLVRFLLESPRYFGNLLRISYHINTHEENVKFIPQNEAGDQILQHLNAKIIDTKKFEVVKSDDSILEALSKRYDLVYDVFQVGAVYILVINYASMLVNKRSLKLLQNLTQGALMLFDLWFYGLEAECEFLVFHHKERLATHHFHIAWFGRPWHPTQKRISWSLFRNDFAWWPHTGLSALLEFPLILFEPCDPVSNLFTSHLVRVTQNIYHPFKFFVIFNEVQVKIVQPIKIQKWKLILFCIFITAFWANKTREAIEKATAAFAPCFNVIVVGLQQKTLWARRIPEILLRQKTCQSGRWPRRQQGTFLVLICEVAQI